MERDDLQTCEPEVVSRGGDADDQSTIAEELAKLESAVYELWRRAVRSRDMQHTRS